MRIRSLLVLVTFYLVSNEVLACSCVNPESEGFIEAKDSIFIGEVKKRKWIFSLSKNLYRFKVEKTLRGSFPNELNLWSQKSGAACGYNYQKNEKYLVVAYKSKKKYYSGLCSSWPISSNTAKTLLEEIEKNP